MKGVRRPLDVRIIELEQKRNDLKNHMNRLIDRIGAMNTKLVTLNLKRIHHNLVKDEPSGAVENVAVPEPTDPEVEKLIIPAPPEITEGTEFQTPPQAEPTPEPWAPATPDQTPEADLPAYPKRIEP